ncbi:hypothetical protein Tco_0500450 [Tanacetum coccineum]
MLGRLEDDQLTGTRNDVKRRDDCANQERLISCSEVDRKLMEPIEIVDKEEKQLSKVESDSQKFDGKVKARTGNNLLEEERPIVLEVPVTAKENINKKNDVKARCSVSLAHPNEHQLTFSHYPDAKTMFAAIETRFGGNEATKKT